MRILHVVPELLPCPPVLGGGLEKLAADWARGLAARSHDVHIATTPAPLWPLAPLEWRGTTVHPLDRERYVSAAADLARSLRPDVIHLHNRPGWSHAFTPPVVVSLHNPPEGWDEAGVHVLHHATVLLPVSHWLARQLPPETRHVVMPGHVDTDVFCPASVRRVPRTIVFAGKLDPKKGLDVLLDSLDHLPGWRLRVSSPLPPVTGFEEWQLSVLARAGGDDRVDVLLPLVQPAALADLYRGAVVVVVPSIGAEALGLVPLEAQACATKVVVSGSGGLPETVDRDRTGIVVEHLDPASVAGAVERSVSLEGDPAAWVRERFTLDARLDQLEGVYAETGLT